MLFLALACTGDPEPVADTAAPDDTLVSTDAAADTALPGEDTADTTPAATALPLGEPPPAITLTDVNPNSLSYEQPVATDKQRGVVTGWYFFKAS